MRWWRALLFLFAVLNVVWGLIAIALPRRAAELIQLSPMTTGRAQGGDEGDGHHQRGVSGHVVFPVP